MVQTYRKRVVATVTGIIAAIYWMFITWRALGSV